MSLHTKQKILSVVCNASNKTGDRRYRISFDSLASESVVGVSLKSAVFRNLFYNVVATGPLKNNLFYFELDATPFTIAVPEGFYAINQLLVYLQAGLDAILLTRIPPQPTAVFSYSPLTGKVSLLYTDNGNNDIMRLTGGSNFDSINLSLGQSVNFTLDGLTPTSYTFDSIIDLGGSDVAQLTINEISKGSGMSNNNRESSGRTNGMLKLFNFCGAPFGSLNCYENQNVNDTMLLYNPPVNLSNMVISLETSGGIPLDLGVSDMHLELVLILE